MKLQNLLMPVIISLASFTPRACAYNVQRSIQEKMPISAPEKREYPKDNYSLNKEAILPPRDDILEEIEIKYK